MKCKNWLSLELRESIFNEYWQLGNHERRMNYINKSVTSEEIQTRRIRKEVAPKQRSVTYKYAFEIDGQRRTVCKRCFQATLDETEKFIRNTLINKSQSRSGTVHEDRRGKHEPKNKTTTDRIQNVVAHIQSFPKYESHYTRRVNNRNYLPSELNLAKMYKLYCEICPNPVGRTIYESEFHKLNLAFKVPKTDTCHKCEVIKMQLDVTKDEEERKQLRIQQAKHHEEADLAYTSKNHDKNISKENKSSLCFTFDLQQCLPTPYLETSVSFYKRKYWTYNLTIHNCASGFASCYLWHESVAMRGANEIASCLFKEIMGLPSTIKKITFYSDTCGGQNKNGHVAAMFLTVMQLKDSLEEIHHKFLVPGHSHMECDVDHSLIEKQKKKTGMKIAHPHDWATLIRCTNNKKPFNVVELSQEDFYDFAKLLKTTFVKRQKDSSGAQFRWHDCKWLKYTKHHGIIYYKNSLNNEDEFHELNFNRRGRHSAIELKKSYTDTLPIAAEKKAHLLDLLPLIPVEYRSFYNNLKTKAAPDTDPDLEDFLSDDENMI